MAGYGTDEGFTAWLASNGYVLPGTAPAADILRQRGSVYIDGEYGPKFPGTPVDILNQERAWPRTGAIVSGVTIPVDLVPQAVINASYFAAYQEGLKPGSLIAKASGSGVIKREKIEGAVETEYFENKGDAVSNATVRFSHIEGLLAPFLGSSRYGHYGAVLVV
jgi:hypothetical protein